MSCDIILIVDDEEAVRTFFKRSLELDGQRVLEASGGPEALQLARENQEEIGVIVTDFSMPGMTGVELANSVAKFAPAIPVVLMSALPRSDVLPEMTRCTWTFLSKPVSRETLLKTLRSVRRAPAAPAEYRRIAGCP